MDNSYSTENSEEPYCRFSEVQLFREIEIDPILPVKGRITSGGMRSTAPELFSVWWMFLTIILNRNVLHPE